MRLKVLGCSGAESLGHMLPGFLLDGVIQLDAGTLTNALSPKAQMAIGHIFITHPHFDHTRSIPFLADNMTMRRRKNVLYLLGSRPTLASLKKNIFNNEVWPDFTVIPDPADCVFKFKPLREGKPLRLDGYSITPIKVNHTIPSVGYLVEKGSRSFFYTGDTGPTDITWKKIGSKRLNALIIESSFPNALGGMAIKTGHLTPELAMREIRKLKHMPERIYITHVKTPYLAAVRREVGRFKMKNVSLLKDGQTIRI